MQKTNGGYLATLYMIPIGVGIALIVIGALIIQTASTEVCAALWFGGIVCIFGSIPFVPQYLHKQMCKKATELEPGFPNQGFDYGYKFTAHNAIFYFDADGGRLGVIWRGNAAAGLQFADLRGLTDVRVSDGKMLGGTQQVRTMFKLDGKQYSIPTFRARQQYSMKSGEVLEAISKADKICEMLNAAKQSALNQPAK